MRRNYCSYVDCSADVTAQVFGPSDVEALALFAEKEREGERACYPTNTTVWILQASRQASWGTSAGRFTYVHRSRDLGCCHVPHTEQRDHYIVQASLRARGDAVDACGSSGLGR